MPFSQTLVGVGLRLLFGYEFPGSMIEMTGLIQSFDLCLSVI